MFIEETDWRREITDPTVSKIFEALEDESWEWRTLRALSKASGLDEHEVFNILKKYSKYVHHSSVPGPNGEDLYTLEKRYQERKGILQKGWDFLSST